MFRVVSIASFATGLSLAMASADALQITEQSASRSDLGDQGAVRSNDGLEVTTDKPEVGSVCELLDLRAAATLKPWKTRQQSSYDPSGGYYDAGHFVRIDPDRHLVLLDEEGPGCIDRMWFTRKKPQQEPYELLIYVDSTDQPTIRAELDEFFTGNHQPFAAPLVGRCGLVRAPSLFSYTPIGFRNRCKVILVPTAPDEKYQWRTTEQGERVRHIYYQITYRKLPKNTPVRVFRTGEDRDEAAALDVLRAQWSRAGQNPWGTIEGVQTHAVLKEVVRGSSAELFRLAGPGVIYALTLTVNSPATSALDGGGMTEGLVLEITWDGTSRPQVSSPISSFFAAPDPRQNVLGLWAGCVDRRYYTYLPMPFARSAELRVANRSGQTVTVSAQWNWREEALQPGDGRLGASWYDYSAPPLGKDYVVLDQHGAGHVVAITMDRPGHMEGDDRWFVDGEETPSIHGTGTEDFFNFAWGLGSAQVLPLHGMSPHFGRPVCTRCLLPGAVPYRESIRLTWEHGHTLPEGPNTHQGRYSGTVLFYTTASASIR